MIVAVWGAKGRVGAKVCEIATNRGHRVFAVDKDDCNTFDMPCDVVIDFSLPNATQSVASYCKRHNTPLVLGTTGHNKHQIALLQQLKEQVQVVHKANYSKGIAVVEEICKQVALATGWDVAIVEKHRKGKVDCPSGTAKRLASLLDCTNVLSVRAGNEFGTHTVVFGGENECIEITHRATSVDIFALGALEVAEKLVSKTK